MSSHGRARKILEQVVNIKTSLSKQNNLTNAVSNNNIIMAKINFLIDLLLFKKDS